MPKVLNKRMDFGRKCTAAIALQAVTALLLCGALRAHGQADSAAMERQFQAAMAAEDGGDLRQAEALLRDLHAKHPGIFAVDESLGLLYVGQEKFAEALPLLEAAAKEESKSDTAKPPTSVGVGNISAAPAAVRADLAIAATVAATPAANSLPTPSPRPSPRTPAARGPLRSVQAWRSLSGRRPQRQRHRAHEIAAFTRPRCAGPRGG